MGPQLFNSRRRDRRYLRSSLSSSSNSCEHALYSGAALVGWGAPFVRYLDNSIDFTVLPAESQHLTSNAKKCLNIFFLYQRQGDVFLFSETVWFSWAVTWWTEMSLLPSNSQHGQLTNSWIKVLPIQHLHIYIQLFLQGSDRTDRRSIQWHENPRWK